MSDCPITFPALAFGKAQGASAVETLDVLDAADGLYTGTLADHERHLTWQIVDARGSCWKIAESRIVGRPRKVGRGLTGAKTKLLFEPRFERLADAALDQVKARIVAAMRADPDRYVTDEMIHSVPKGGTIWPNVLIEPNCAAVEAAVGFEAAFAAIDQDFTEAPAAPDEAERERRLGRQWAIGCLVVAVLALLGGAALIRVALSTPEGRADLIGTAIGLTVMTVLFGGYFALKALLTKPRKR